MYYLGIDVAKAKLDCAVQISLWKVGIAVNAIEVEIIAGNRAQQILYSHDFVE